MSVRDRIIKALEKKFHPFYLNVEDFSASHAGHSGSREGGESHFSVVIVSNEFGDRSMTERHRMIYALLNPEIQAGLHALKIKTLTIEEARKRNLLTGSNL
ncbi:MAG TPA: BolA family protein [Alphaproteobacteria bacterium]|nr:BolA family protein [Alphaproteobacteria bacterium]